MACCQCSAAPRTSTTHGGQMPSRTWMAWMLSCRNVDSWQTGSTNTMCVSQSLRIQTTSGLAADGVGHCVREQVTRGTARHVSGSRVVQPAPRGECHINDDADDFPRSRGIQASELVADGLGHELGVHVCNCRGVQPAPQLWQTEPATAMISMFSKGASHVFQKARALEERHRVH